MSVKPFDTRYFERYARLSLVWAGGAEFSALRCADLPDLQAPDRTLGVEVTRAMLQSRQEARTFSDEIAGRLSGYDLRWLERLRRGAGPHCDSTDPYAEVLAAIRKKVDRLESGDYDGFDRYGLYVFSAGDLSRAEALRAAAALGRMQRGLPRRYGALYLNQVQRMYFCTPDPPRCRTCAIPPETQERLHQAALDPACGQG